MQKWTDSENDYLNAHWQTQSRRQMAKALDRSIHAVRFQCRKLGLTFVDLPPKSHIPSRLEVKQQRLAQEEASILAYLEQHGYARKSELYQQFKISNISKRLRTLKESGQIKYEQRGLYLYWTLGQQIKEKKKFTRTPHVTAPLNLHALPEHIRRWFGLIDFTPPKGRIIEEKMPDIPLRRARYTIGAGTQFQIGELASL